MGGWDQYIHAMYFTVTTMTTVGYGDMSGANSMERVFCIILMVVGVIVFTFISGAISSVLSNMDSNSSEKAEQALYLSKLHNEFNIKPQLYNDI